MAYLEHHESEYDAIDIFDGQLCQLIFTKSTERCDGDDLPNDMGMGPAYDMVGYKLTGLRIEKLELTREQVAMIFGDTWISEMEKSEAENDY